MNTWISTILVIIGVIFLFKMMGKGGGCCGGSHKKGSDNKEGKDDQRKCH
tara:strand:+ start:517 stop:666 length:150 start_codon:yes stop_codon:yes gene_type:complete